MPTITDPANDNYDFGQAFNYAVWPKDTRVSLVNVPWNNDYRDIVSFPTPTGVTLDQYIDSIENAGIVIDQMSYVKPMEAVRIPTAFNKVNKYNYLRATNPLQPISGGDVVKNYYYFITGVTYLAPNTTEITLQLDVWQTFGSSITFGNCYIERGHIGIANENAFDNYGRDYLTVPEGLDTGSEYQVIAKRNERIIETNYSVDADVATILAVSAVDLNEDPGDATAPILKSAKGSSFQNISSGATMYVWESHFVFGAFLEIYQDKPWVTQGILSITMIPNIKRYYPDFVFSNTFSEENPSGSDLAPSGIPLSPKYSMFDDWRTSEEIWNHIPAKYWHLKKFLTSPYMFIEMTTFTGNPVLIKPEIWTDNDATIIERAALVPPNQRVTFHPYRYNAHPDAGVDDKVPGGAFQWGGDDNGDFLDIGTAIANFPTLPIVNNGAIGYLASNVNTLAYQGQAADWSQTKALRGNQVSYDQASSGITNASAQTGIGVGADAAQTDLRNLTQTQQGMLSAGAGIVSGAVSNGVAGAAGGAGSALAGGINNAIAVNAANQSFGIRAGAAYDSNAANRQNATFIRDTNKDLGDFAAKGDYENQIAGIQAKVRDANLIQPNVSGQFGGEMMNLINHTAVLSLRFKMIDLASIISIGDYWLRYGYAVQRFATITTLRVMEKFSYWKVKELYITSGQLPENFKQSIRGIFEKGVTVWHDPNYIGNTDLGDNAPMEDITL